MMYILIALIAKQIGIVSWLFYGLCYIGAFGRITMSLCRFMSACSEGEHGKREGI